MVGSAGVGVTPGPSHWKSGVPVTPVGRVTEQVRVTVAPAMMVEEGEEVREMVAGSVEEVCMVHLMSNSSPHTAVDTYHNSLCFSLIAGQCSGGSYHGDRVGGPCNQSSDDGSSGSRSSIL